MGFIDNLLNHLLAWRQAREKRLGEMEAENQIRTQYGDHAKARYIDLLTGIFGKSGLAGIELFEAPVLGLNQVYVNLNISQSGHSKQHDILGGMERQEHQNVKIEEVIRRTFFEQGQDVLLIEGDPGSGKTTLLAHLFDLCQTRDGYRDMGYQSGVLSIYLPLRDFQPELTFSENFAKWATA